MSSTYDHENGEPAPIPNDGPSMHDLAVGHILAALGRSAREGDQQIPAEEVLPIMGVTYELEARKEMGLRKYGTILQAHNGRNSVRDAMDESLDLIVYICQIIEEGNFPSTVNMDSMYRNACEFAIGLKYILIWQENKKNDDAGADDSGHDPEAGSSDLAGGQHFSVSEIPG